MIQETNLLINPLGKSITRNMMTGTAAQLLLPTKIGGFVKFLVGTVNPFWTHTDNWIDPTIKPIIIQYNQANKLGHRD